MTPAELLECWEDELINNLPDQKNIVASMIVHDAHPNVVVDFSIMLFTKYGPPAVMELKELIKKEYERNGWPA